MRKVLFSVASSLDNYIARQDGAVDWLLWNDEAASFMKELWKKIDTVLWGRKTYEVALRSGNPLSHKGVKNYVFSQTMKQSSVKNIALIDTDVAQFVRDLKTRKGKDIFLMGGGELAKSLFEAKLIDGLSLNIHPILLGQGVPLFRAINNDVKLVLLDCKTFKNSCLLVSYRVEH
jgi:dihydrofolate reductase